MAGRERKEAALARLRRKSGDVGGDDQTLAGRALETVSQAVEDRDPPSGDQALREAVAEVQQMRAEKRAKSFVRATRR